MRAAKNIPWLILAIVALAAFLRFLGLSSESLWGDEAYSVHVGQTSVISIIQTSINSDTHPPLYYLMLHFWMLLFGQSEIAVRALSACLGIISVLLIYKVGRELYNSKIGLIASLLMTISTFAIYSSQEARQYSLLLLLTLLSFLFFIRIIKADKPNKLLLLCYSLTNILICYTHLFGLFAVGAQVLYFLLFRRRYVKAKSIFWVAQVVTLISFSPWIYVLVTKTFQGAIHGLDWIPETSFTQVAHAFAKLSDAASLYLPLGILLMLTLISLGLAAVFCSPRIQQQHDSTAPLQSTRLRRLATSIAEPRTALLLFWFFFPVVMTLIFSLTARPMFESRYLIEITPAIYLLTARGIDNINSLVKTRAVRANSVTFTLIALITFISIPGLYNYYTHPGKEQWRETTTFIEQRVKPDDAIVLLPDYLGNAFNYYYKGNTEILVIPSDVIKNEEPIIGKDRLWLIYTTYESTKDASLKMKSTLSARYGSDSIILYEEFQWIAVYLLDIKER